MFPHIIVNCKAYKKGIGRAAVRLGESARAVAKKYGVRIALAVQSQDISEVARTGIPVFAQHVDPIGFGAFTGQINPVGVKMAGAVGTLLNHAERRLVPSVLKASVGTARKAGLQVLVCAAMPEQARQTARLCPTAIAVEPPELIGGKIAVSQAKPEVITQVAKRVRTLPVLCGAGVHTGEDVQKALELGAWGVLVSSSVVNARNPRRVLAAFAQVWRKL